MKFNSFVQKFRNQNEGEGFKKKSNDRVFQILTIMIDFSSLLIKILYFVATYCRYKNFKKILIKFKNRGNYF